MLCGSHVAHRALPLSLSLFLYLSLPLSRFLSLFLLPLSLFFSCLVKRLSWTIKTRFEKRLDFFLVEIWRTTIIFQMCVILWGGNICVSPIGWKTLRCHESFKVLWFFDWFVQWWMDQFWVCFSVRKWLSSPTLRDNLTAIGFLFFLLKLAKKNEQIIQEVGPKRCRSYGFSFFTFLLEHISNWCCSKCTTGWLDRDVEWHLDQKC